MAHVFVHGHKAHRARRRHARSSCRNHDQCRRCAHRQRCFHAKFSAVDEVVFECTTSTGYVGMPDMKRTFAFGGTSSDQAMATFSGSLWLDDGGGPFDTGFIRLTIDGVQQTPGESAVGVNERGMHTFNFQTGKPCSREPHRSYPMANGSRQQLLCRTARFVDHLEQVTPRRAVCHRLVMNRSERSMKLRPAAACSVRGIRCSGTRRVRVRVASCRWSRRNRRDGHAAPRRRRCQLASRSDESMGRSIST